MSSNPPWNNIAAQLFHGESELDRLCREKEWSSTPLGAISDWSPCLRTAASLVTASPSPMILLWGPELVQIYNDGYREVMGDKHPIGLGQPTRECWPEVWEFNAPIFEQVRNRASLTFENQRLVLERHGFPEEAFFTLAFSPVIANDGQVGGVLATVAETTETIWRDQVEQARRDSEARYRLIGRATNDIIWDWNLLTNRVDWNEAVLTQLGCTPEELGPTVKGWYCNIHPEDRQRVVNSIHTAIEGGADTWRGEYRFRRSDGSYATFLDRGYIARDDEGRAYRMIGSMLDLTERRRMEEAVRTSQERLARVLEIETVGVLFFNLDSHFIDANDAFLRIAGVSRADIVNGEMKSSDLTLPEWMPQTMKVFDELRETGRFSPYEKELIRPDGSRWWGLFTGAKIGPNECVEFVVDVTAQRNAEQARHESEARFRTLADLVPDLLWRAAPDGTRTWGNRRWSEYTGLDIEASFGYGWAEVLHPEDRDNVLDAYRHAIAAGQPLRQEHRVCRRDGAYRWFLVEAVPIHDKHGRITQWFGAATDIHEQHITRERLEELVEARTQSLAASEERFRLLVTTSAQIIWSTDPQGRIAEDSPSWRAYTGQGREEWLQNGWDALIHPDDRPRTIKAWLDSVASGTTHLDEFRLWHAPTRAWRWVALHGIPLRNDENRVVGWFGSNTDIEERKRAEAEVRHMAYRLTMAEQEERRRVSQILHDDLQQLLYGLQFKLRMVSGKLLRSAYPDLARAVEETQALLGQAVDTTRQLTVDLSPPILKSEGLLEALEWLQRQMLELHGLEVQLGADQVLAPLKEDLRVLLFQIVRELLFNVKKHAGTTVAYVELRQEGQILTIQVEDRGYGANPMALEGDQASGTGFGLANVRERLRQIGGRMIVDAEQGRGTRVIIQAPRQAHWAL
ncbi:PAS domain-containing sensor histidine kinase [Litchfieldella xinjiangensis]|uniref:PAS domain-containing sensor histidine kinase n=1 Tax=Litchfieldella xinjiangensis TaxID=1166948 RepID=UPI0005B85107|nr:PAS domain-containing sensor histidine kinase [Halomonas xinjiangensis]